jgi:hypothetical protein
VVAAEVSNADRILEALRIFGPSTDAELRKASGVETHQQVNQICRRMESIGVLKRIRGADGHIVNVLDIEHRRPHSSLPTLSPKAGWVPSVEAAGHATLRRADRCLLVIPCSGRKAPGGARGLVGPSVTDWLPGTLADRLLAARAALASRAELDESILLPAYRRYVGTLYATAANALESAHARGVPMVILSGGYGLLVAGEPIGVYNRRLTLNDWPSGLLEDCLLQVAQRLGVEGVLAFCARTTSYAALIGRIPWRNAGLEAFMSSPVMGGRGGAQVLVPRALGEALVAALDGQTPLRQCSSDGVEVLRELVG